MIKSKPVISILGSGWLGLPLAELLAGSGFKVKASTRARNRLPLIEAKDVLAFLVDIENVTNRIQDFLESQILIINITSKNIEAFSRLIKEIENSNIEKVLFISSTSVYKNLNRVVIEDEGAEDIGSLLYQIEKLFQHNKNFQTSILRFSGLIGYSRHPGRFFKNGKSVQQSNTPVNLIHRDDCLGIITQIIEQDVWGEVFNATATTHPSKRDFYSYARQSLMLDNPDFVLNDDFQYKIVSNLKVRQVLNYQFIHPNLMELNFDTGFE